jgi:hypothetical protein
MRTPSILALAAALGLGSVPAAAPARHGGAPPSAGEQVFARKVRPLLVAKCLPCHGDDPGHLEGGLDLSSRDTALQGGDSGEPAVVPHTADESPLYRAVLADGSAPAMPPKKNDRLTRSEVWAVRDWINAGAPWPDGRRVEAILAAAPEGPAGVRVATSGGLAKDWDERLYDPANLWAYRPLVDPEVPRAAGRPASNPIDAFLAAGLSARGLSPAPAADLRALIRRATFDLTGLPPTPEEVAAFVDDPDPDDLAFSRVVDRLLASPHYGERWGQHWLDVARYADSSGFANDYQRGNAWRYRDYVVRSFNADKPYDRFVAEQLAGDELDPGDPEMLVAVGFLRSGAWELTGMEVPRVARQRFLDDVTDAVGQVFLAQPLQCARCHDHKFDPIPARDYYRLQAAFATTQPAERPAPFLPGENRSGFEERRHLEARRARYVAYLDDLGRKAISAARAWYAERGLDPAPFEGALAAADSMASKRPPGLLTRYQAVRQALMDRGLPDGSVPPRQPGFTPADFGLERIARKGLERLAWELDRYEPIALSVYSGRTPALRSVTAPLRMPRDRMTAGTLESPHILAGGDPFAPRDPVTPGVLSAVPLADPGAWDAVAHNLPERVEGRRAALTRWVTDPANPLTPRVMVNRVWHHHFGRGIAGTPNNFGATGKRPTHPELLDWLARRFVEGGWSVKALHRLIMGSEAYRRSSVYPVPKVLAEKDPEGTSYAAFAPRRLTAEEIRDAMLAVSGELNRAVGGIPVRPEIDAGVALQPRMVMGTFAPAWEPSARPERRHRRSIYALKLRGLRDPFFEAFNQPPPETPCEARESSTVTPQVFSLFNGPASYGRALAFARRLTRETAGREAAVRSAFLLAYGRPPTPGETRACLRHWDAMTERHRALRLAAPARPRQVVREAVEENTGERFIFTEVLDAADFVPDPHPADSTPELRGLMEVCLVLFNANEFVSVD